MRIVLFILDFFLVFVMFGQKSQNDIHTEELLNEIFNQVSPCKNLLDAPAQITEYDFDGDYSPKRLFPWAFKVDSNGDTIMTAIIDLSPVKYYEPIYKVLINLDPAFDSVDYQNKIKDIDRRLWSKREVCFTKNPRFVKWKLRKLYHEIYMISTPIFNKTYDIALIKFMSMNGNSRIEKRSRIWIFKRIESKWRLQYTIYQYN